MEFEDPSCKAETSFVGLDLGIGLGNKAGYDVSGAIPSGLDILEVRGGRKCRTSRI